MPRRHLHRSLFFIAMLAAAPPALAHQFTITVVDASLHADRSYQIDMKVDVDALALGAAPKSDSAELAARLRAMSAEERARAIDHARQTLLRRTQVRFDGRRIMPEVRFPEPGDGQPDSQGIVSCLGVVARLTGRGPANAETFEFGASRAFNVVHLTIEREGSSVPIRFVLQAGERSPSVNVVVGIDGHTPSSNASTGTWKTVAQFVRLGFRHIVPEGTDHILFVLGLFLLSRKWRPLLWQITAFTVAHSVTLALSMYGVFSLRPAIVEPLIALSIAYVAVENMMTDELKPWRPFVVFGFGLLHGLGFAGVLREIELPRSEFATALVSFNVGVELGQLSVVLTAWLALFWSRKKLWYRSRIARPLSGAIACIAIFWTIQRIVSP